MALRPASRRYGVFGLGIMGLLLILGNGATATTTWFETSYSHFNGSDTISNLEIKAEGPDDVGKVHLEDANSESHNNIYNDPTATQILCDDPNANPAQIGKYSQSFSPNIDGVVDKVEVMIYYAGDPIHTNADQSISGAMVTLKIVLANAQSLLPGNGASLSERTMSYHLFPSQSASWTTVWFSYGDSCGFGASQLAVDADNEYALVVSSNADWDPGHTDEIYMEYKISNNGATQCGEWDTAQKFWHNGVVGNPAVAYDFPFNITVHNFVSSGYLISKVYNTNNPGTTLSSIQWGTDGLGGGRTIHIYTRGGDTSTPDQSWSSWLEQTNYWGSLNPVTPSPHGQYLQYKLELATTDTCYTPFFDHVLIYYN